VDVMPTILEWIGAVPPPRSDGQTLSGFCRGAAPKRWREAAHWEGDFRAPGPASIGASLGLIPSECSFAVRRDARFHYVHFAGLPPLLFDLAKDPGCLTNVAGRSDYVTAERAAAQAMLSWRMATSSGPLDHLLARPGGLVEITA
ncbi:MAG: sulfatase, partial [Acetobacteraceae bacterium]